tara:strand:- start:363 stop:527 length:165 start_codon:yes stop_codon:yes gene_type:complete
MMQLVIIRTLINIKTKLSLSARGLFFVRKILNRSDINKKTDAINGAENNKNIPI